MKVVIQQRCKSRCSAHRKRFQYNKLQWIVQSNQSTFHSEARTLSAQLIWKSISKTKKMKFLSKILTQASLFLWEWSSKWMCLQTKLTLNLFKFKFVWLKPVSYISKLVRNTYQSVFHNISLNSDNNAHQRKVTIFFLTIVTFSFWLFLLPH